MRPKNEGCRRQARTAGRNQEAREINPGRIERGAQGVALFPAAIWIEHLPIRKVEAARDMAFGNIGARVPLFPGEAGRAARIHQLFGPAFKVRQNLGLGAHDLFILPNGEMTMANSRLAAFQRAAFGFPFGQPAI